MSVQMYHPKLDDRVITVEEVGVPIHEDAGWILGDPPGSEQGDAAPAVDVDPADETGPTGPEPSPRPTPDGTPDSSSDDTTGDPA